EMGDHTARGLARVVPPLERGNEHRVDELGEPFELDHVSPPAVCTVALSLCAEVVLLSRGKRDQRLPPYPLTVIGTERVRCRPKPGGKGVRISHAAQPIGLFA